MNNLPITQQGHSDFPHIKEFSDVLNNMNNVLCQEPNLDDIAIFEHATEAVQRPIIMKLQVWLSKMEGKLVEEHIKREICSRLTALFHALSVKVLCPRSDKAGQLRLKTAGRNRKLVFEIQVKESGRYTSHYSSSKFPILNLIDTKDCVGDEEE